MVPTPDRGAEPVCTLQAPQFASELPQHRRGGGTNTVSHHTESHSGPYPQAVLPQGQNLFIYNSERVTLAKLIILEDRLHTTTIVSK